MRDYLNRLTQNVTSSTTSTYAYDMSNIRIKEAVAASTSTLTTHYPTKHYNISSGIPTKHVFANGAVIATIVGSGASSTVSFVLTDHLTGSSVVTNASGSIIEASDYYPYGAIRVDEQAGFNEQRKFAGHEYDAETGLSYMQARYYNGSTGRFVSQDPVFLQASFDLADPQALNAYAYARNNPLIYIDPDGKAFVPSFVNGFKAQADGIYNYLAQPTPAVVGQFVKGIFYDQPVGFAKDIYSGNFGDRAYQASEVYANMSAQQREDFAGDTAGKITAQGAFSAAVGLGAGAVSGAVTNMTSVNAKPTITQPYSRPSNATTQAQRVYVNQNNPRCSTCGVAGEKMFADHKTPLVKEYYQTGGIDMSRARSLESVRPQCSNCSARQGADLRIYSSEMKKTNIRE